MTSIVHRCPNPGQQNRPIWDCISLQQQPNTAHNVVNNPGYALCNSIQTGQTVVLGQLSSINTPTALTFKGLSGLCGSTPLM